MPKAGGWLRHCKKCGQPRYVKSAMALCRQHYSEYNRERRSWPGKVQSYPGPDYDHYRRWKAGRVEAYRERAARGEPLFGPE
jgi:hypothetical protein